MHSCMHISDVRIALFDCNFQAILQHYAAARILLMSSVILMHAFVIIRIRRIAIIITHFWCNSDAYIYGNYFPSETLLMSETDNVYFTALSGFSRKLRQNYNRIAMGVLPAKLNFKLKFFFMHAYSKSWNCTFIPQFPCISAALCYNKNITQVWCNFYACLRFYYLFPGL